MANPHLSAEHRDRIASEMVAEFVAEMKSDVRFGHPWMGLSIAQQQELGEKMADVIRPLVDDMEKIALKALKYDEEKAEAYSAGLAPNPEP